METFKIENFLSENRGISFPEFRSLGPEECDTLRERIASNIGFGSDLSGLDTATKVMEKSSILAGVDAESDAFSFLGVASSLGIVPDPSVFVNWYRFDQIDEFSTNDLNKYFSDIWYPGPDDIDVFDSSCGWIISVRHDGCVSWLKSK